MKYLRHILKEAEKFPGVYSELNPDQAAEVLKPYKDIILKNSDIKIYRGMGSYTTYQEDFLFGEGSKIVRKSANTSNFYTNMMCYVLPKWKPFPRRDNSFICSSEISRARTYGGSYGTFLGIPLENQKIGVCPTEDLWESFTDKLEYYLGDSATYLNDLNSVMVELLEFTRPYNLNNYDAAEYKSFFEEATNVLKHPEDNEEFEDALVNNDALNVLAGHAARGLTLYQIVEDLLDPEKFRLETTQEYLSHQSDYRNNEVWMSGKVLFIKTSRMAEAFKFIEKL